MDNQRNPECVPKVSVLVNFQEAIVSYLTPTTMSLAWRDGPTLPSQTYFP